MPLHDAIHHRKPQTRATFTLGSEEWFEAFAAGFFVHANTGVRHVNLHGVALLRGAQRQCAPFRHRIHGVEDQVGKRLAQLAFRAKHLRKIRCEPPFHLDLDTALLRHVAPAGVGKVDDLFREHIDIHWQQHRLHLARAIELAQAHHCRSNILDGAQHYRQLLAGA